MHNLHSVAQAVHNSYIHCAQDRLHLIYFKVTICR